MRLEIDSVPEEIDDIQPKIMQLDIEREAIRRENNKEKETILTRDLADLSEKRDALKGKWQAEKSVLDAVRKEKEAIDRLKLEADQAERQQAADFSAPFGGCHQVWGQGVRALHAALRGRSCMTAALIAAWFQRKFRWQLAAYFERPKSSPLAAIPALCSNST